MARQRRPRFIKRLLPLAALVLVAAVLPLGSAAAQQPPQQTNFPVAFRNVATPGTSFDVVQSVIDYNAGAKASASVMNVPNYLTVLEGELTIQVADKSEGGCEGQGPLRACWRRTRDEQHKYRQGPAVRLHTAADRGRRKCPSAQ